MPSHKNLVIIAAAGSRKTEYIIEQALADPTNRVLITTFTNHNQQEIVSRIQNKVGTVPSNITVMGWFSFLVNEAARPYQNMVTKRVGYMGNLNFVGQKSRFAKKTTLAYFFDTHGDIYRDGVSDFACVANDVSGGLVLNRLEARFDSIYIDEVQDLSGWDLDFLHLLLQSSIAVTVVGDPRQDILATNNAMRNSKYRKAALVTWFEERNGICTLVERVETYRSNQLICDFADALFPHMPKTKSLNTTGTDHDGIFVIKAHEVADYVATHKPTVLRDSKRYDTLGLPALNIGVSKGSTYDRVLIFPTKPMLAYVKNPDLSKLKTNERLYIAVTRARHSATFVES